MNKIILKNSANYLSTTSFWSNYKYFNRAIHIYNDITFFSYEIKDDFVVMEEIFEATISSKPTNIIYKENFYKKLTLISSRDYHMSISTNYDNFESFIIKKTNTKYDLILSLQTSIFIVYFCCRSTKSKKRLWNFKSCDFKKNCTFKYNNNYYRIGKIEEYNIKKNSQININSIIKTPQEQFQLIKIKTNKLNYSSLDHFTVIFDLETMAYDGQHYPYMIYAKITSFNWPVIIPNKSIPDINLFNRNDVVSKLSGCNFEFPFSSHETDSFFDSECCFDQLPQSLVIDSFLKWFRRLIITTVELYNNSFSCRLLGFNNNRFDNNFFLAKLRNWPNFSILYNQRFNKVSQIVGSMLIHGHKVTIYIDDLIKFLPETTLKKACKDYQIEKAKIDFDIVKYNNKCSLNKHIYIYDNDITQYINDKSLANETNIFNVIKKYCILDVESTCELYQKISSLMMKLIFSLYQFNIIIKHVNFLRYISIPQLAFNIFLETARINKFYIARTDDCLLNDFIITSCIGGRVNYGILGEYVSDNIKYMDVTSEYPLSMTAPYPSFKTSPIIGPNVGQLNKILDDIILSRNQYFLRRDYENVTYFKKLFCGIFRVNIYPPLNEYLMVWSPIPLKVDGRNLFKNIAQNGRVINTTHIRILIYAGWKVEIIQDENNILFTSTEYIMKPFINLIGTMKTWYTPINKSFAKLCKLIMNSVSGKLAQKVTCKYYSQRGETRRGHYTILDNSSEEYTDYSSSLHYLSSFITGYANWILFSTACKLNFYSNNYPSNLSSRAGILLYTDTDSIVFDANKTSYTNFVISEQLGSWNEDKCDFDITWKEEHAGEIKKLIVLARKSYALIGNNNSIVDLKLKGIHTREAHNFTYESLKIISSREFSKKTIRFAGLKSEHFSKTKDIIKRISETELVKTLALEKNYTKLDYINESNLENCANLDQTFIPSLKCSNFLVYTQADIN